MARKKQGQVKLSFHTSTGQYRKYINGQMLYFGTDANKAIQRYLFFLETGLVYKSGYSAERLSL